MRTDAFQNSIKLHFDARNKDPKNFVFDKVSTGDTSQKEFFDSIGIKSIVRSCVKGFHGTIFAYG